MICCLVDSLCDHDDNLLLLSFIYVCMLRCCTCQRDFKQDRFNDEHKLSFFKGEENATTRLSCRERSVLIEVRLLHTQRSIIKVTEAEDGLNFSTDLVFWSKKYLPYGEIFMIRQYWRRYFYWKRCLGCQNKRVSRRGSHIPSCC
jgi:hypothetical protein